MRTTDFLVLCLCVVHYIIVIVVITLSGKKNHLCSNLCFLNPLTASFFF